MLKNYFTIALRSFNNQKLYALVNLTGLTIAIAVAILATLFILHELSYDQWIPNQTNIYKVYRQWEKDGGTAYTPVPLAPTLPEEFPEVQYATRLADIENILFSYGENSLYVDKVVLTDSSMLKVLSLPLQYGDAATALAQPNAALLSDEMAHKLFGNEIPVGKTIRFNDEIDLQVTAVLAPPAGNTHLQADIYFTASGFFTSTSWTGNYPATYIALHPQTNVLALEQKMTEGVNRHMKEEIANTGINFEKFPDWRLQPLQDVHLNTANISGPFSGEGNIRSLYIIGLVALVVLAIASINYMNLATAQAISRAREVGVRKVTGASNRQLVVQFLTEATLQALVALPLAMLLAHLTLPIFETVVNRDLTLNWSVWKSISGYLLALVLGLGILAGSYPAFFLAAYRPTEVLKGQWLRKDRGKVLRHGMVVAQFASAMVAAIVMFFIYQQVRYMQNQELGFHSQQVVVVPIHTDQAYQKLEALKPQMLQKTDIESIATSTILPGTGVPDWGFEIAGVDKTQFVNIGFTDPDFAKTLDLEMVEGRFFSSEMPSDTVNAYVVNEAFVREYNLKEPIGHQLRISLDLEGSHGTIIGVAKDFHYSSLEHTIKPLALLATYRYRGRPSFAIIRIGTQNVRETIAEIEQHWKQIEPTHPIRYSFLDQDFAGLYIEQERLGQTLLYATLLTLLIAILGLFALASYMAEQRIKEIGVRKVLGASIGQIVVLLGKDFLKLVLIAGLVATPISLWLAYKWLSHFAYKTDITALPFLVIILIGAIIALLTVSSRALRAAMVNPVENLRNE